MVVEFNQPIIGIILIFGLTWDRSSVEVGSFNYVQNSLVRMPTCGAVMFQIHIGRVSWKPFFIFSTSNHFIMLWTGCFMYVEVVRKDPLIQLSASM